MRDQSKTISAVWRLCAMTILLSLLSSLLLRHISAQTAESQAAIPMATITRWHDSLRTLQAPTLIAKQYASWKKHYDKTLSEYQRDSTSSSYERKSQLSALEFGEIEPLAFVAHYLAEVDSALSEAKRAGAKRYAPTTFARAEMYRAKSADALVANRNNLKSAGLVRSRARYEARHALTIAQQITPIAELEDRCERTILHSESQLQSLGETLAVQLRFSEGSNVAIASLALAIAQLKGQRQTALDEIRNIDSSLKQLFEEVGVYQPSEGGAEALMTALSDEFRQLVRELDESKRELRQYRRNVSELRQEKEIAETILSSKEAEEQRFAQTKALFNSNEAIILYNGSHDIVIRLRGMTFPSGVAQLSKRHDSLLAKVTSALALSPSSHIIVEGHTDNTGGATLNVRLSEKRAEAVMQYLIESTGRPAKDFQAIGYGAEKPVANNQTEHGRKENRRIDIVIVR
jgi:OmpA-OmpF porin, OOP family